MYGSFDKRERRAFSLVEVTLALGLLVFALVALLALLPNGLTSNRDASRQMAAASVASQVLADLREAGRKPPPQVSAIYGVNLANTASALWVDAFGAVQTNRDRADFLVEISCGPIPTNGAARTGCVRVRWPAATPDPTSGLSFFFAY
jgi:type II secretory pathway pseudopilin PulG